MKLVQGRLALGAVLICTVLLAAAMSFRLQSADTSSVIKVSAAGSTAVFGSQRGDRIAVRSSTPPSTAIYDIDSKIWLGAIPVSAAHMDLSIAGDRILLSQSVTTRTFKVEIWGPGGLAPEARADLSASGFPVGARFLARDGLVVAFDGSEVLQILGGDCGLTRVGALHAHSDRVVAVATAQSAVQFLSLGHDGMLCEWSEHSLTMVKALRVSAGGTQLSCSADGKRAAVGSIHGIVIVDLTTGVTGRNITLPRVGGGPFAFSQNGEFLVIGGEDRLYVLEPKTSSVVREIDARMGSGQPARIINAVFETVGIYQQRVSEKFVESVFCSRQGIVWSAGQDGTIRIAKW